MFVQHQPVFQPSVESVDTSPQNYVSTNRVSYDTYNSQEVVAGDIVNSRLGYDGYCPVSIVAGNKWAKGNYKISMTYDSIVYYFASENEKALFARTPERFIPALGGDCVVCFEQGGSRVTGSVHHAATHQDRLYLFPGETEKQAFMKNPSRFADVDLAAEGNCVVSRVNSNESVMGSPEHIAVHNGMRYWFTSADQRNTFDAAPSQFDYVTVASAQEYQPAAPTEVIQ